MQRQLQCLRPVLVGLGIVLCSCSWEHYLPGPLTMAPQFLAKDLILGVFNLWQSHLSPLLEFGTSWELDMAVRERKTKQMYFLKSLHRKMWIRGIVTVDFLIFTPKLNLPISRVETVAMPTQPESALVIWPHGKEKIQRCPPCGRPRLKRDQTARFQVHPLGKSCLTVWGGVSRGRH